MWGAFSSSDVLGLRKMNSLVAQTGSLLSSKGAPPKRQCKSAFTWTWSVRVMLCNFHLTRVREWCCVRQCIGRGSQVYQVARAHMWRQCHRSHSSISLQEHNNNDNDNNNNNRSTVMQRVGVLVSQVYQMAGTHMCRQFHRAHNSISSHCKCTTITTTRATDLPQYTGSVCALVSQVF